MASAKTLKLALLLASLTTSKVSCSPLPPPPQADSSAALAVIKVANHLLMFHCMMFSFALRFVKKNQYFLLPMSLNLKLISFFVNT
jgi:hypothetical protein